jgi:small conductance mechanosensitive channel
VTTWADFTAFLGANATVFRILAILAGAVVVRLLVVVTVKRVITRVIAESAAPSATESARKPTANQNTRLSQRTQTLGSVLRSISNWVIGAIATILILSELGFQMTAIIASLGILGAGVALGAQDIIRDICNGIFMVFEDQLGVGDKVDLGDAKGVVEEVTIRVTKIRDSRGVLWFVRNGQIQRVANSSHRVR